MDGRNLISRKQKLIVFFILAVFIVFGAVFIFLDWHNIRLVATTANWMSILIALLLSAAVNFCLSWSFLVVNRIYDIRIPTGNLFVIGYVSSALSNLLDFMGLAGHSLRLLLMQGKEIEPGQVLAASLIHSYFNNLIMLSLLPLGVIYLILNTTLNKITVITLGVVAFLLMVAILYAAFILFNRRFRLPVMRILQKRIFFFLRRDLSTFLGEMDRSMKTGGKALKEHPQRLGLAVLLIIAQWTCAILSLWFCFYALGTQMNWGVLITGFAVGIIFGNLSLIPAGLGVQEVSFVGIYVLFRIPLERAVLAALLFRMVYDFIPFFVSLPFYNSLLRIRDKNMLNP